MGLCGALWGFVGRGGALIDATFVYIDYGASPLIGLELRYSLLTLRAEILDARVVVYTDKPDAHPNSCPLDWAGWTRGGAYPHRIKPCVVLDAIERYSGLCVLMDTDSYITPGFAEKLAQASLLGPLMDHCEEGDPYPELAGWGTDLPSGHYTYTHAPSFNSGLIAVRAERDRAAVRDALALIDALWDDGKRQFNIEQIALSEAFRIHTLSVGAMRPFFQHYCRRSLKRYMHWRLKRLKPLLQDSLRPCIAHPHALVRAFNWVDRLALRKLSG